MKHSSCASTLTDPKWNLPVFSEFQFCVFRQILEIDDAPLSCRTVCPWLVTSLKPAGQSDSQPMPSAVILHLF